jgi:pullulanase
VVYNHTSAAGQDPKSVLDRIVPGYYHRLNPETGAIETSTCCPNTATEHNMMEKLMIDSLRTWATEYKVDAFRFDLMGHHMLRNMVNVRAMLDGLTPARDGVDGKAIYIYGEGWNFGEVANNARGVNATQINTAGTGIGTFNDRLRDAVRGGNPFENREDLIRNQGFSNGLYYDPNELNTRPLDQQRNELLLLSDRIRVGLAGNLRDFTFIDRKGNLVKGSEVDYNGSPTGYTLDPQEVINYVSKHDNQTLFDILAYKAPRNVTMAERVRMQNLALSIVGLGQGVPFFHAGSDMLRSKSLDRDSYNSGDWFNRLDFTYRSNNFGVGLPIADKNQENWDIMRPILRDPNLLPGQRDIMANVAGFREILEIRKSSPLFRLRTAEDISQRLRFLNTGPDQVPGMIVMALSDRVAPDLDPRYEEIMVIFNATDETQTFTYGDAPGEYMLHPVQAVSADAMVRGARFDPPSKTFTVPARTTAVFVSADDRTAPTPNPEPTTYRYLFPIIINRNN